MIPARTRAASAVGLAAMLALGACSSGQSGVGAGEVKKADGKVSPACLQKQGDQEYFVGEAEGAKARAAQLGVGLKVVNLGNDANKAVSELKSAIAQKVNGLIIVVPDPAVGPEVVQAARGAKMHTGRGLARRQPGSCRCARYGQPQLCEDSDHFVGLDTSVVACPRAAGRTRRRAGAGGHRPARFARTRP